MALPRRLLVLGLVAVLSSALAPVPDALAQRSAVVARVRTAVTAPAKAVRARFRRPTFSQLLEKGKLASDSPRLGRKHDRRARVYDYLAEKLFVAQFPLAALALSSAAAWAVTSAPAAMWAFIGTAAGAVASATLWRPFNGRADDHDTIVRAARDFNWKANGRGYDRTTSDSYRGLDDAL